MGDKVRVKAIYASKMEKVIDFKLIDKKDKKDKNNNDDNEKTKSKKQCSKNTKNKKR